MHSKFDRGISSAHHKVIPVRDSIYNHKAQLTLILKL